MPLYIVILIAFFVIGVAAGFLIGDHEGQELGYDEGWLAALKSLGPDDDDDPPPGHQLRLVWSAYPDAPAPSRRLYDQAATA